MQLAGLIISLDLELKSHAASALKCIEASKAVLIATNASIRD